MDNGYHISFLGKFKKEDLFAKLEKDKETLEFVKTLDYSKHPLYIYESILKFSKNSGNGNTKMLKEIGICLGLNGVSLIYFFGEGSA